VIVMADAACGEREREPAAPDSVNAPAARFGEPAAPDFVSTPAARFREPAAPASVSAPAARFRLRRVRVNRLRRGERTEP